MSKIEGDKKNILGAQPRPEELRWADLCEILSFCESYYVDVKPHNVLEKLHKIWINIAQGDWCLAIEVDSLINMLDRTPHF